MTQYGINWNDMGTSYKRGSCCVRNRRVISTSADGTVTCEIRNPKEPETAWVIDNEIPIFKGEGRKSADKTWAFLELRPTGKVVSKEQYEYVLITQSKQVLIPGI